MRLKVTLLGGQGSRSPPTPIRYWLKALQGVGDVNFLYESIAGTDSWKLGCEHIGE